MLDGLNKHGRKTAACSEQSHSQSKPTCSVTLENQHHHKAASLVQGNPLPASATPAEQGTLGTYIGLLWMLLNFLPHLRPTRGPPHFGSAGRRWINLIGMAGLWAWLVLAQPQWLGWERAQLNSSSCSRPGISRHNEDPNTTESSGHAGVICLYKLMAHSTIICFLKKKSLIFLLKNTFSVPSSRTELSIFGLKHCFTCLEFDQPKFSIEPCLRYP